MDWKYLRSLRPGELADESKDELLNTIAWYDLDENDLDLNRSLILLRISQEIMKFKGEQVEALLAELDEIAARQGEEEAKKQDSDYDVKSMKSKVSSAVGIEDLEDRYRDLKLKCKKLQKAVEKQNNENDKLKQNITMLEKERVHLQNELKHTHHDESASDISESVKDQQKDLIDTVHQKNTQISTLLTDIEKIESDNLILRKKLTTVRDELADATEKLELLITENEVSKLKLQEASENTEALTVENESLKNQVDDVIEDKKQREAEFEDFAKEVDVRVEEWKKILEDKNSEIRRLKSKPASQQAPSSRSHSTTTLSDDHPQLTALNRTLAERQKQILELQRQLQTATREMEENTAILKRLTADRDEQQRKCEKATAASKEFKKQLKVAHARCQELQEEVTYQAEVVEIKNGELREILGGLRDGEGSIKEIMEQVDELRSQKKLKEKQISNLVRTCNKLQTSVDTLENENVSLRDRLGLSDEDYVSTKSVTSQQRRQKKVIEELKQETLALQEEQLEYRMEVQKLSKIISNLSDQIIDLGETPKVDFEGNSKSISESKSTVTVEKPVVEVVVEKSKVETAEIQRKEVDMGGGGDGFGREDYVGKEQYVAVVQENEALRKGLHEILASIRLKQESREIKSDTLESLLRALDAKHISGWYHPAMRLQAELHALEGSNKELREQLRNAREELENFKEQSQVPILETIPDNATVITNLNKHLLNVLKNYHLEEETNSSLIKKLEEYRDDFAIIQKQVALLYTQYFEEKQSGETELAELKRAKSEAEEKAEISEAKLNIISEYVNPKTDDDLKMRKATEAAAALVVMNRKCIYLENQDEEHKREVKKSREELLECETATMAKIDRLNCEIAVLAKQLECANLKGNIVPQDTVKLQRDFDNLIVKERQMLRTIEDLHSTNENELIVLTRRIELLEDEKKELQVKLHEALSERHNLTHEQLSKKLAQSELNETTERQRANHTNNLYELVKEQLQKSEDRYKEYQKYNNEIMHKNLILQDNIKELEDKILHYVSNEIFENLQNEHVDSLKTQESLIKEKLMIESEFTVCKKIVETRRALSEREQGEILNLKHQIVDLQSTSDDKAVIARLSSDVVMARMVEGETRRKLEEVLEKFAKCEAEIDNLRKSSEFEVKRLECIKESMENKVRHLEMIIKQQRHRYIGFIPFTSEYKFAENITQIYKDKKLAYENLQKSEEIRKECNLLKENFNQKSEALNELNSLLESKDEQAKIIEKWYHDKNELQLQELRFRRQSEFKETQIQETLGRLSKQQNQLESLEIELLQSLSISRSDREERPVRDLKSTTSTLVEIKDRNQECVETQTSEVQEESQTVHNIILNLENELSKARNEVAAREEVIQQLNMHVGEMEKNVNLFRQQINDKQSQIIFYEKHIMEMQSKKEQTDGPVIPGHDNEENISLKSTIKELQEKVSEKENSILEYQSLLKKDRDVHSLAAARFQEELRELQTKLSQREDKEKEVEVHPGRAAIEQYILQVHALEKHTSELHTNVSTLTVQLQASREEAVRWRALAYDRLQNMEELRVSLQEQHQNELLVYKSDSDKWREEVKALQHYIARFKKDISDLRPDIEKEMKEKDNKIHELTVAIRQLKTREHKRSISQPHPSKEENLEDTKESLLKEHEVLKKRCEQLLNRERNARDEIRLLKGQLMKKPLLSSRSDSSNTKENQFQKKISNLEKENHDLKEKLEHLEGLHDAHKLKVNEDFEKWSKQKFWQQTSEKLKSKLKEKTDECEKLQQTCSGYRMLIERLEREKHNLEARIKSIRSTSTNANVARRDMLEGANAKLIAECEMLKAKLEIQHMHSGGLGAAMLQEKLEAQERKIAILEMSAKGSGELRAELERVQCNNAGLQKSNLRLEAENLDIRLDLEKSCKELPHLREQILHLEHYIEVLKTEKGDRELSAASSEIADPVPESKRIAELERTVFVLKRIVEKLQVENKRLLNTSSRPCSERANSAEQLKRENRRLKEQYVASVQKINRLEKELNKSSKGDSTDSGVESSSREELEDVRSQLKHKSELLERVKVLLQRAAAKEKELVEEVAALKALKLCDCKKLESSRSLSA